MNGAWPCQLSHACLLAPYSNWLGSLSYHISLPVPIKSDHGHGPSLMWRLEKIIWLFLKHVDDEYTQKQKSKVQNKTRGPTLFFSFQIKKGIFSADLSTPWQVTTTNNTICIRGGSGKIIIMGTTHLLKCYHSNCSILAKYHM